MPVTTPIKRGESRRLSGTTTATIEDAIDVLDAPSELVGWSSGALAGSGGTAVFDGTASAGQLRRRAFYISNIDPNSSLDILDEDDNFCLRIFPETSIVIPTSETVKVRNNSGAEISLYVSELFYTS